MLKRLRREAILTGSMVAAVVGLSMLGYLLLSEGAGGPSSVSPAAPGAQQEPPTLTWEPANYRTEQEGIGLTIHTYRIRPDYMAFLYSVDDSTPDVVVSPGTVALTDDLGQTYSVLSNAILGNSLGVTAGLLTVEPYRGQGKTLTLSVTGLTTSGDASATERVSGTWNVAFIETLAPGAPVDYSEGGRIAPEVMSVGGLTLAVAGQPGGRFVKLLIDREGRQGALYGDVSGKLAEALSEAEFHTQLGAANEANAGFVPSSIRSTSVADDYPPPPDWPAASQP
jgi:hypothetical protein